MNLNYLVVAISALSLLIVLINDGVLINRLRSCISELREYSDRLLKANEKLNKENKELYRKVSFLNNEKEINK